MNNKKLLALGLTVALSLGAVGCNTKETQNSNKKQTQNTSPSTSEQENRDLGQQNTTVGNDYTERYQTGYNNYIKGLENYTMYNTAETTREYYKTNEYPGNEKYVNDLKSAYKDSKEKIRTFIDDLKNNAKTDDADLKKMNENLIAAGERTIDNIDKRLKKLDELPKDIMNKSQDEFINAVDEATRIEYDTENGFDKLLRDMNKALGLDTNMNNNNTNTNKNENTTNAQPNANKK